MAKNNSQWRTMKLTNKGTIVSLQYRPTCSSDWYWIDDFSNHNSAVAYVHTEVDIGIKVEQSTELSLNHSIKGRNPIRKAIDIDLNQIENGFVHDWRKSIR